MITIPVYFFLVSFNDSLFSGIYTELKALIDVDLCVEVKGKSVYVFLCNEIEWKSLRVC